MRTVDLPKYRLDSMLTDLPEGVIEVFKVQIKPPSPNDLILTLLHVSGKLVDLVTMQRAITIVKSLRGRLEVPFPACLMRTFFYITRCL